MEIMNMMFYSDARTSMAVFALLWMISMILLVIRIEQVKKLKDENRELNSLLKSKVFS